MKRKLEICCYTVESAIKAEQSGADRIELCDNYSEGGTTPSFAVIDYTIKKLGIPVNVIVRPRGGDFLYSELEYDIIKHEIKMIKELNANAVVIGFLKSNGEIDIERTKEIVKLAAPMEVTFHRAFDMCRDPLTALEQLKTTGIKRILTSGSRITAVDGIDLLSELVKKADNELIIMPGGDVDDKNIDQLLQTTRALEYHSAASVFENSKMEYFNQNVSMGGVDSVDEFKAISVDPLMVQAMASVIH
ncbi:MAG: copper homeostasis protein CutC [Bacteroidales bacterium]|nr:copper homeostasis protein CutC [Bacteroidales bacterium]